MTRDFAVFLRGISNVSMEPFHVGLAGLGLADIDSFGATGNFVCCTAVWDSLSLERRIDGVLGVDAFVRSRPVLAKVVSQDPYRGRAGASVFFSKRPLDAAQRSTCSVWGYRLLHPTRRRGRKGVVDFERELGVRGTMRGSRVVERVLDLMPRGRCRQRLAS